MRPATCGALAGSELLAELATLAAGVLCKRTAFNVSYPAQMVKNLPEMQETWVRFQGQEDALEEGVATHSTILAWRIRWTEEPGGLQSMGSQELDTTE